MTHKLTLNDVFSSWKTGIGVFYYLQQNTDIPWRTKNINSQLDIIYHGNRSGRKIISPMIRAYLDTNEELSGQDAQVLINAIVALYGENWSKQYATLSAQYNPIENYRMSETENSHESGTNTGTDNRSLSGTDTGTDTHVMDRDESSSDSNNNTNSIYGFNSQAGVGANSQAGSGTGSVQVDYTDTETRNLASSGTDNRTLNLADSHQSSRGLSRSGNIGVTTSQQMLQSEHELWMWNFFTDVVFADLDRELTLAVYE